MAFKSCKEGWDRTKKECTDLRDDGWETCGEWGQDCVDWAKNCVVSWIPIIGPMICKVFEWVCRAFEWVCRGMVWISNMVCHAWNFAKTLICYTVEVLGGVLSFVGVFIKAILSIPIIGALIKQIINLVTGVVFGVVGFIVEGILCGLGGLCLSKKMRVCVIITHNGRQPVTTQAVIQPIIDRMVQIYQSEANVVIEATVDSDGRVPNVQPGCGIDAWLEDLGLYGTQYEHAESLHCREYNLASVVGLGSPIYAFCVTDVAGKNGCSLWLGSNYVTFEPPGTCSGNTHLAHEVGHACGLNPGYHDSDPSNLMYSSCTATGRTQLSPFQKVIVRGAKYCTYF